MIALSPYIRYAREWRPSDVLHKNCDEPEPHERADAAGNRGGAETNEFVTGTALTSESEVSAQLYDARPPYGAVDLARGAIGQGAVACSARHRAVGTRVVPNVGIWVAPINVIEHIVSVGPDFERDRLVQRELFCDTEVHVRKPRSN